MLSMRRKMLSIIVSIIQTFLPFWPRILSNISVFPIHLHDTLKVSPMPSRTVTTHGPMVPKLPSTGLVYGVTSMLRWLPLSLIENQLLLFWITTLPMVLWENPCRNYLGWYEVLILREHILPRISSRFGGQTCHLRSDSSRTRYELFFLSFLVSVRIVDLSLFFLSLPSSYFRET